MRGRAELLDGAHFLDYAGEEADGAGRAAVTQGGA